MIVKINLLLFLLHFYCIIPAYTHQLNKRGEASYIFSTRSASIGNLCSILLNDTVYFQILFHFTVLFIQPFLFLRQPLVLRFHRGQSGQLLFPACTALPSIPFSIAFSLALAWFTISTSQKMM